MYRDHESLRRDLNADLQRKVVMNCSYLHNFQQLSACMWQVYMQYTMCILYICTLCLSGGSHPGTKRK